MQSRTLSSNFRAFVKASSLSGGFDGNSLAEFFSVTTFRGPCSFASLRTRFGDNEHSCVIITVNCKRFVKPTRAVIVSLVIYNKKALPAAN